MDEEIEIKLLNEEDIDDVNHLYNRIYKSNRTNLQFRWEFMNGPAGKSIYVIAVTKASRKIIGTQCAIPLFLINSKDERILSAKSEDTLVDPAYRGKQIFEKMYALLFDECRRKGIKYLWGFTYTVKPFQKIGFETPFKAIMGLLPFSVMWSYTYLSLLNPKNSLLDKFKIFILNIYSKANTSRLTLSVASLKNYSFHKTHATNLNDILKKNTNAENFFLFQDESFLKWRIYENAYDQKFLHFSLLNIENKQPVANIIFSINKQKVANIIQLIFLKELPDKIIRGFIKKATLDLKQRDIILIRTWGFLSNNIHTTEVAILKSIGFTFINRGITFVWKSLDEKSKLNPTNMFLSKMAAQGTS